MDDLQVERILRTVESLPAGRVATYGDIGAVVGESPRLVGRVLASWGSTVPWWRVCNARGEIPGHGERARRYWLEEGLPLAGGSDRLDLGRARIDLDRLRDLAGVALAELAGCREGGAAPHA